jgi:hypothetical protein
MRIQALSALGLSLALSAFASAADLVIGESVSGELTTSDSQGTNGRYQDVYSLEIAPGQAVAIDLASDAFDTYLAVAAPDGRTHENDDIGGSINSRVLLPPSAGGTAQVTVTSYNPDATGAYTLKTTAVELTPLTVGQNYTGSLASGEVMFTLPVSAGQTVVISAASSAFDTTLSLSGPGGEQLFDDDGGGGLNSRIIFTPRRSGDAILAVAPYDPGHGAFTLTSEPLTPLAFITHAPGTSSITRSELASDESSAVLGLRAPAGQRLTIDATSDDFDTMLAAVSPDDGTSQSDDDSAGGTNSRLTMVVPAGGELLLIVSSYDQGKGGDFALHVSEANTGH